jgi:hypothetical protein
MRWSGLLLFAILGLPLAGQPGIGLATPPVETLVIDSFPFTYQNKFRVYNNGEEERVFVISISAPYQDILDWITVDASIFTLPPGETKVIQFSIYAESGYRGEYDVIFKPTLLPTQTVATPDSAMAHLAMSAAYKLTLIVPEDLGRSRPEEAEITPEEPRDLTRTVDEMEETKASAIRTFDKQLLITLPKRTYLYEPTFLSVKFIEGEEPAELGFVIVSPSGKTYRVSSDSVFSFDEEGSWSVLIVIKDEIIVGNPLEVDYDLIRDLQYRILPQYGIFILFGVVLVSAGVYLWRRNRR